MTKPIRFEHFQPCLEWWDRREENEAAWKVSFEEIKARHYNLDVKNPHTVDAAHADPAELLVQLEGAEGQAAQLRDKLKGILAEALLR